MANFSYPLAWKICFYLRRFRLCKVVFFNHVNISLLSFGFNYAYNGMYKGCLWLAVVSYGSVWSMEHPCGPAPTQRLYLWLRQVPKEQNHSMYSIFSYKSKSKNVLTLIVKQSYHSPLGCLATEVLGRV